MIIVFIVSFLIFGFNCVYAEQLENDIITNEEQSENNTQDNLQENENQNTKLDGAIENNETPSISNDNSDIQIQKVKVITSKVDEEGNPLIGATLQIIDKDGQVIDTWVTDGNKHETLLPDGTYILHEKEAPEGYDLAEDQEINVSIVVEVGYKANTERPNIPCETVTTYYVEVKGKRHEVYCINQFLTEPGPDADYNGKILTPEEVRNYTQQIVFKDPEYNQEAAYNHGNLTDGPIDVSDQSLTDEELYNILLDIVYRRTQARKQDRFKDTDALPDEAISFLTEMALKTYTNAGVTQIQRWDHLLDGDEALYVKENNYYWYLMHMYRDYKYDPDSPNGFRTVVGQGDAFGNFARHWTINKPLHGTRNLSVDHPIYAEFFYYLMGDEVSKNLIHPSDMHIYIYKAANTADDDEEFQNLLGITGYLEDFEPEEKNIEMINKYSTEKRNISVVKVWNDNNHENLRPNNITINLYADGEIYKSVELNESNNWSYTFEDLDVYNKGKKIIYTINESGNSKYSTEIKGDMETGFTVTNTYYEPTINPKTGDNISFYIMTLLFSLIGFISISYAYKYSE